MASSEASLAKGCLLRERLDPIKKSITETIPLANPYRAILRREYSWVLIAVMAFALGFWLFKNYFNRGTGYEPGTERLALIKIDRDLRLADAMEADGPLLRWLAGVKKAPQVRQDALEVFYKLAKEKSLTAKGLEAYSVVMAQQNDQPMRQTLEQILPELLWIDFLETAQNLSPHQGAWWHAKLLDLPENQTLAGSRWLEAYQQDKTRLKTRTLAARSVVWALSLVGLVFVPGALLRLKKGLSRKGHCYGNAWPLALGLMVFFLATLAWISFTMILELSMSRLPQLHPAMWIFFDSAARLLPPLIAIALLFKRPAHAVRVMGIFRRVEWRGLLGIFSLLVITDQVLRWAMKSLDSNEPGGGLSHSEAGLWGLAFTLISACLLAPITEEVTYRGVLFRSMNNRFGALPAALGSSMIFALLHFYDAYGLATVALFGFSCAALYSATGSLATVIVLHMLYNAAIKIPNWIVYHTPL